MATGHILKVYVAGLTPAAKRAVQNLREICAETLDEDHYEIEVIDIREHPEIAERQRILATPTVVKELPEPIRRVIGDLSDKEQVLVGLDLVRK